MIEHVVPTTRGKESGRVTSRISEIKSEIIVLVEDECIEVCA
jgi:hypothetical protein